MKSLSVKLAIVSLGFLGLSSCDKGKVCECTSVFSDGSPNTTITHETLDKTSDPDCTVHEGITEDAAGVTTTVTCEAVTP